MNESRKDLWDWGAAHNVALCCLLLHSHVCSLTIILQLLLGHMQMPAGSCPWLNAHRQPYSESCEGSQLAAVRPVAHKLFSCEREPSPIFLQSCQARYIRAELSNNAFDQTWTDCMAYTYKPQRLLRHDVNSGAQAHANIG